MNGSKLATVVLGACWLLVCACQNRARNDATICERYAELEGPAVDPGWCAAWLSDWHTRTHASSRRCLSRADSRLEMRQCEFQDEEGATAYPFARRECALAATTLEQLEACATTAPVETEKTFAPIGPEPAAVKTTTVLGLIHRDGGWHALLLEPGMYVRSGDDPAVLTLVPVSGEGFGEPVWRLEPEGFDPYAMHFLIGDELFAYVTRAGQLRTVRLTEQAVAEVALELEAKRRIVAHALVPGPAGARGVVITQPQGSPQEIRRGGSHADEKRGPVTPWLPRYRVEPLGGEARTLVEYTDAEVLGSDVKFARSAVNHPGAHPAVAWTGPHGDDKQRPLLVALFDDDGIETHRSEVEGFEVLWLASTSDGITTVLAKRKFMSERDITVFRFSVDGEVGERRRLNWRSQYQAVAIACRDRLALVRVGGSELGGGGHGYADYWDLSGREELDLPERIWWGKRLSNTEIVGGCADRQPAVAWLAARASQSSPGTVDSHGSFDLGFMPLP